MKSLLTTLFFISALSFATAQQIDLTGQISIHNSRYRTGGIEYVADAFVQAPFAGETSSDSEGLWGLTFQGMEKGTVIKLSAEKVGLEVVNSYDLERVVLGQKPRLPIYLAPKGRLAQAQTELYNISKDALYTRRDGIIARLQSDKAESDAALAELQEDWGIQIRSIGEAMELLDSKIEELEKRLPEFAQELAAKNLDFASELYIEAYELYQTGDVEGAIAVLNDAKLEQSYQAALGTIAEGKDLAVVAEDLQEKGQLQIDQIVESYKLKAEGHNVLFEYRKAAEAQRKAVEILEASTEGETIELATAYGAFGSTLQDLGSYSEALQVQLRNTVISEKLLSHDDPELASSYNDLATIYSNLGDYEAALHVQKKSLAIQEQVLEPNHPDLATSYNNLAIIYLDLGDYEAALDAQQKSLSIREQVLEPNNLHLAIPYNNLATIYLALGNYEAALAAQKKSLSIREQVLEPNHPDLATSYNNLAAIYQGLGDYEAALAAQKKSFGIREQVLEPNHPRLAISYNNVAVIYRYLGDYEAALHAQQKALAIQEQVLEPNHPDVAQSYNNLALIYNDLGDYEAALYAQQKDIVIKVQILEPNHPRIATSYHNLVSIFDYQGQLDSALVYENRAYTIWQEKLPANHPNLQKARNNFDVLYPKRAAVRREAGAYRLAIEDYERALEFSKEQSELYNSIGLCYYYMKNYSMAIENYEKSYQLEGVSEVIYTNNTGMTYAKSGELAKAAARFTQLEELLPENGLPYRDWGLYYVLKGEPDTALDNLEKAIQLGYDDWEWLRTEEALDPLRDHPRFQALLENAN